MYNMYTKERFFDGSRVPRSFLFLLFPLKCTTSGFLMFFRGYRTRPTAWNGLRKQLIISGPEICHKFPLKIPMKYKKP